MVNITTVGGVVRVAGPTKAKIMEEMKIKGITGELQDLRYDGFTRTWKATIGPRKHRKV